MGQTKYVTLSGVSILCGLLYLFSISHSPMVPLFLKGDTVPEESHYIVRLKESQEHLATSRERIADLLQSAVGPTFDAKHIHHVPSTTALPVFTADLHKYHLLRLQQSPHIAYIEEDQEVRRTPEQRHGRPFTLTEAGRHVPPRPPARRLLNLDLALSNAAAAAATAATAPAPEAGAASHRYTAFTEAWTLDRLDQRQGLDGQFLSTDGAQGRNVNVYVFDTGIRLSHEEFQGRAAFALDVVDEDADNDGQDCSGHGTHVAGSIAGRTFGVAPEATVHDVRVLRCNSKGKYSGIIRAIDWLIAHARKPAIAVQSIDGPFSHALNDAVSRAVAKGITFVVAAGNSGKNACASASSSSGGSTGLSRRAAYGSVSPASSPDAIAVGSTDFADQRSAFSNFGDCVAIYGPGVEVISAWGSSDRSYWVMSGTSMTTGYVAGAIANIQSTFARPLPPKTLKCLLLCMGTPMANTTRLLYTNLDALPHCYQPCGEPAPSRAGAGAGAGGLASASAPAPGRAQPEPAEPVGLAAPVDHALPFDLAGPAAPTLPTRPSGPA